MLRDDEGGAKNIYMAICPCHGSWFASRVDSRPTSFLFVCLPYLNWRKRLLLYKNYDRNCNRIHAMGGEKKLKRKGNARRVLSEKMGCTFIVAEMDINIAHHSPQQRLYYDL